MKEFFIQIAHQCRNLSLDFVWLDSNLSEHPESSDSWLAIHPQRILKKMERTVELVENEKSYILPNRFFDHLDAFVSESKSPLFGYLGYDLKNEIEDLHSQNPSQLPVPQAFLFEPTFLLQQKKSGEIYFWDFSLPIAKFDVSSSKKIATDSELNAVIRRISMGKVAPELQKNHEFVVGNLDSSVSRDQYIKAVQRCQHHIHEGDCYEINLSRVVTALYSGDPFSGYVRWRQENRVPFGAFMSVMGTDVLSMSPERFLKRMGSLIESHPIKGTRRRQKNLSDEGTINELQHSEKDRAENLMIVDLVRNDLSHVCEAGSVKTKDLFQIQTFDTVFQMVSKVIGKVRKEASLSSILRSCFPMGSMTGAPKVRVMQLIEEIETYKRGIYSGAIGYMLPNGDFDFNVVIRTVVARNGFLEMGVGGAITSDSDPEQEWEETETKAHSFYSLISSI